MSKNYNEKTRVQMPAMIHLTRLGFNYIGKMYEENAGEAFDSETNILIDKFRVAFERLNPSKKGDWLSVFSDIKKELNDDDLGKQFYERLISVSPYKLIDFDNPTMITTAQQSLPVVMEKMNSALILLFL